MAKLRGKRKWRHSRDLDRELKACEIKLDGLHQKITADLKKYVFDGESALPYDVYQKRLHAVAKALGHIRSAIALLGHEQKTLKRWTKPAPNQAKEA